MSPPPRRPKLLVANFFPAVVPPRSGGEQRYFHLYQHLSRDFDVTLLSPTYPGGAAEEHIHSPYLREFRIPKDPRSDSLHWSLEQAGIGRECSAYVVALAGAWSNPLAVKFSQLAPTVDVIVHESPYTVPYDHGLGRDGKPRVYNSYNVETKLAGQILRGEPGRKAAHFIRELEAHLLDHSAAVFATSSAERQCFIEEFGVEPGRVHLVPNGFEPGPAGERIVRRELDLAVFLGSAHPPNVEAVHYIAHDLAAQFPAVRFKILGSVCSAINARMPGNVELLGFVDDAAKADWLRRCTMALNPMFTGAGTSLKMLDYMAHGAPILCTPVGARGIELVSGSEALLCDAGEFANALRSLLMDDEARAAMGEAAEARAMNEFTWSRIAEAAGSHLLAVIAQDREQLELRRRRRQLLVLNDFPVDNASGGGQVRIAQLLGELGREFDVLLLCLGSAGDVADLELAPGVVQRTIAKTAAHLAEEQRTSSGQAVSVNDILSARHCLQNPAFVEAVNASLATAALIIFEHPYLAPMLTLVPKGLPVVYSSLNVEMDLKADLLARRSDGKAWLAEARELELRLLARADLVIGVSTADCQRFQQMRSDVRCEVVENGVHCRALQGIEAANSLPPGSIGPATALFLGSAHPPNVDAARFIIDRLAPALPDVVFMLVGTVCDALERDSLPDNVLLLGLLAEREKNVLLASVSVAVNPMLDGGGSSLKVPDFFAAGLPVISTLKGVRGYAVTDGEHFLLADEHSFAQQLRRVLDDVALRSRLSRGARCFAAHLDWRMLGGKYRRALRRLLPGRDRKRILAATYRFGDPPPGGAEAYLANVLRELAANHPMDIDVTACHMGQIVDHLHFSALYEDGGAVPDKPAYLANRFLFPIDHDQADVFQTCQRLHRLWMGEARHSGRRLAPNFQELLLLGGWNFPERRADGSSQRWASTDSEILLDSRVDSIRIQGVAPEPCRLTLRLDGQAVGFIDINGTFDVALPANLGPGILALQVPQASMTGHDPRELGFVVTRLICKRNGSEFDLALERDFESLLRQIDPQRWIDDLIETCNARDPADDALFIDARGPHSTAQSRWLETRAADYDLIIAQGVPFASCPKVVEVANRNGVAVLALPHFHMEDRYYHWQSFHNAFRSADRVIAAPSQSRDLFYDRIGAQSAVVPGGGLEPREFDSESLQRARLAFRELHRSLTPYVLVLGRKSAAKHYSQVVEAVRLVRAAGHALDLVMVGPDEDGLPVEGPGVHVFGAQPRELVLGALAEALCLANMSDSESFGIVLLEAWMAGVPVIAGRRCLAFADLVEDGGNGFLAGDPAELAGALIQYLQSDALRGRHVGNGRQLALQHTWRAVADRIAAVIHEVTA